MPDVRYVIDINLNNGEASGNNPNAPTGNKDGNKNKPKKESKPIEQVTALYLARQAASYATSRVQMFTGSSASQAYVNNAMKLFGYGAAIVANPVIGLSALAFDLTTSAIDYNYALKMERVELEQRQRLLGALSYGRSR